MKKLMKIVGMELVKSSNPSGSGNGIVKLILLPKDMVKVKKPSLSDMVTGNLENVIEQVQQAKQYKSCVYISMSEYLKHFKNQPLSDVYIDIVVSKYANEIAKGG